jgi:hypothetical protein
MIQIRCSGNPPTEMELSGTRNELTELREAILRFCARKRPLLEVPVDLEADPGEVNNLWDHPDSSALKLTLLHRFENAEMRREPMPFPRIAVA